MADLEVRRAQLGAERAQLRQRIERIHQENRQEVEGGQTDGAHHWENAEVREGALAEATAELEIVDAALARLDQGTYGTCAGCGRKIPPARLEALPHAVLCVRCAEAAGA